jgi:hypothetical protein
MIEPISIYNAGKTRQSFSNTTPAGIIAYSNIPAIDPAVRKLMRFSPPDIEACSNMTGSASGK